MKLFEMFDKPKRVKEETEGQYGVYAKGGSIGGNKSKEPIKTFTNKKEAQEYARRMRKALSPGERKHYKMSYVTKPITETSPQQDAMEKNSGEDALRAELSQAQIDGHPEDVERLQAELDSLKEAGDGWPARGMTSRDDYALSPDHEQATNDEWRDKPESGMLDADIVTDVSIKFPEDDIADIAAWADSAEEYGQPLTVEEYAKWRQYDEAGNLKEAGVSDTLKKGAKWLKRGVQGWKGDNSPGLSPEQMSRNVQGIDTPELKKMDKFHTGMGSDPSGHSPRDLSAKLTKRNLRKRGERDFEKYMPEGDEDKTWNTLKGQSGYDVTVRHNFYGGKHYEIGYRPFRVLARSPEEAKQFVINNLELVEKYFRNLRLRRGQGSIPAIRKSESYHAKPSDVTKVTPTGLRTGKIFNTDGEQIPFNSDDYPATESVNEAAPELPDEQRDTIGRLERSGGTVYSKATLVKGNETAILAQNGDVRFAIYSDGKFDRAKEFINFQRDGWELEMKLGEDIVPYTQAAGNSRAGEEAGDHYDDETGQIFRPDEIEKDEGGKMIEKPYRGKPDDESLEQWKDNYNKGYEDEPEDDGWLERTGGRKSLTPAQKAQAEGMFGDIAAGGGDPIDYLITELGMEMEDIDAMAIDQGYEDANEWAESYQTMESIVSNFKKLDRR